MKILIRAIVGIGLIYATAHYFGWYPPSQYVQHLNYDVLHSRISDTLQQLSVLQTISPQALHDIPYDAL